MGDVIQELEHLNKLAKEDPEKRFNRLYRLLYQPELLRNDVPLVLHHPNRLRNVKRVQKGYGHVARSGADQEGKLLCQACHLAHHHGHTRQ